MVVRGCGLLWNVGGCDDDDDDDDFVIRPAVMCVCVCVGGSLRHFKRSKRIDYYVFRISFGTG
jgi:hypothetical protein